MIIDGGKVRSQGLLQTSSYGRGWLPLCYWSLFCTLGRVWHSIRGAMVIFSESNVVGLLTSYYEVWGDREVQIRKQFITTTLCARSFSSTIRQRVL